jgi:hypothetical protein
MESKKHSYPNRATVRLAVLRLMLLPDDEAKFSKDDYEFLKSDLAGSILKHWPSGLRHENIKRNEKNEN